MKRRTWIRTAGVVGTGMLLGSKGVSRIAPALTRSGRAADLVIRGGTVFDGAGEPGRDADVAITGDRVTAIGDVAEAGAVELDAHGMAVAPGFVDVHSHADLSLLVNRNAESRIRQGVTLEVVGQDGSSIGPWSDDVARARAESQRRRYGIEMDFHDLAGFFRALERTPPAVNLASMVGHGTVRQRVLGSADRPATRDEIARMRDLVREALRQGAVGLSSGLEYTPGSFASTEELIELAGVLTGTGLPYASHMRNEDDRLMAAIEETIHIGRMAGVPVQVSHLKAQGRRNYWKAEAALTAIEEARDGGVDVHFDRYPYVAYSTGLTNLFPVWARAGGTAAFLARVRDPEAAERIERFARAKVELLGDWNRVQITSTSTDRNASARGRRLGELAAELAVDPYDLAVRLLEEERGGVGMIGFGMSEENTAKILAHPLGMICSDGGAFAPYGPLSGGSPHPRAYGSFPRLFGHYVRERGDMSIAQAVRKVTSLPAEKLRLVDRGRLVIGGFADVVVFDASTIADRATFEAPHRYPVGVRHVCVNGRLTIRDGEQTGELAGRPIRGIGTGS